MKFRRWVRPAPERQKPRDWAAGLSLAGVVPFGVARFRASGDLLNGRKPGWFRAPREKSHAVGGRVTKPRIAARASRLCCDCQASSVTSTLKIAVSEWALERWKYESATIIT